MVFTALNSYIRKKKKFYINNLNKEQIFMKCETENQQNKELIL